MIDTEKDSLYTNLEQKTPLSILEEINQEDQKVALAVKKELKSIEKLVAHTITLMKKGGRIFYLGAGTSGRLGILDASECPPTYGVPHDLVIGLIAGGDSAIRKAVEFAEDDLEQGYKDLKEFNVQQNDMVIGIAASGRTPYVLGALRKCKENNISTGCIVCSNNSPIAEASKYPIQVLVGPEYVTGSTRMKSGTAQKLVLNMITTTCMIGLGKVKGNKMIDMQIANNKLVDRGIRQIMESADISYDEAGKLLKNFGSVRKVLDSLKA
jgi:N-acetylmuramic acid 6-phosphate etherase